MTTIDPYQPTASELATIRAGVAKEQAMFKAEVRAERVKPGTDRAYALPAIRGPRVEYLHRVTAWRERIARGKRAAKAQYETWRASEGKRAKENERKRASYARAKVKKVQPLPSADRRGAGI